MSNQMKIESVYESFTDTDLERYIADFAVGPGDAAAVRKLLRFATTNEKAALAGLFYNLRTYNQTGNGGIS